MKPKELWDCLTRVQKRQSEYKGPQRSEVALTLKRRKPPMGETVGIAGRFGPRGVLLNAKQLEDGSWQVLAKFSIKKLKTWLKREFPEEVQG